MSRPRGRGGVGAPAQPCPPGTLGDLRVHTVCAHDNADCEGVRVELTPAAQPPGTTDQNGAWTFRGINPGAYNVRGTKANHKPATQRVTVPCGGASVTLRLQREPITCYLRLTYRDPEGVLRPFPAGVAVQARSGGATQNVQTQNDGRLQFQVPTGRDAVQLRFSASGRKYVAVKSAASTGAQDNRLVLEAGLNAVVNDHYHTFMLPAVNWNMGQADWQVDGLTAPVTYANGRFTGFNHCGVTCGTVDAPIEARLDPHWQFLRFVYFDRLLGHTTHGNRRVSVPPLVIEGYRRAPAGAGTPPADTRGSWTTGATPEELQQCLAWIIQRLPNGKADARPSRNIQIQFRTDTAKRYIESRSDGTRRYGTLSAAHARPGPERLRYYDMPAVWKSRRYYTTVNMTPGGNRFEDVAHQGLTSAQALVFCLDDIVLTDAQLNPIAWVPADRVALFSHRFRAEIIELVDPMGVYRADTGNNQSYLTAAPAAPEVETDRNYIADYPDWTRLAVAGGNLFDVFDQRTPNKATPAGRVVGARAAVRWVNATARFPGIKVWNDRATPPAEAADGRPAPGRRLFSAASWQVPKRPNVTKSTYFNIQPYHETQHDSWWTAAPNDQRGTGRSDMAWIRCCDVENGREITVVFQYHRLFFNFTPPAPPPPAPPAPAPPPPAPVVPAAAQAAWGDTAAKEISLRWTGQQATFHDNPPLFLPEDPANQLVEHAGRPRRARHVRFVQVMPRVDLAHFDLDVRNNVRANMGSDGGTGQLEPGENVADASGAFTAAHETGHGGSLGDEYLETAGGASYYQRGFYSNMPGGPYDPDQRGMMSWGMQDMRARYFWHLAEFIRPLDGDQPWFIQQGTFNYRLPRHPTPGRTWVNWPLRRLPNQAPAGTRGVFDLFLWALGHDEFADERQVPAGPTPSDGTLVVVLKLQFTFNIASIWGGAPVPATVQSDIRSAVQIVRGAIEDFMNARAGGATPGRFFATGTAPASGGAPARTFANCFIHFSPRFLVATFSGDEAYSRDVLNTDFVAVRRPIEPPVAPYNQALTTAAYNTAVTNIRNQYTAPVGGQPGFFDITVQAAAPPAVAGAVWNPAAVPNRRLTVTITNPVGPTRFDQLGPLVRDRLPDMLGIAQPNAAAITAADLIPLARRAIATGTNVAAY